MQLLEWKGRGQGTIADPYLLEGSSRFDTTLPFNIKISDNFRNENRKHNYFRIQGNNIVYILSMLVTDYEHLLYHKTSDVFPFILIGTDFNNMIDGPFIISQYEGNNYISKQQLFSHNDITSSKTLDIVPINDDMNIEIEVEYDLDNNKIYINSNVKLKDDEDNLIKETESKELYVSHSDILTDINNKIAEHNTDISSHMNIQNTLKDYTDSELSNHDSDLTSHSDIRANIRYIEENPLTDIDIINRDEENKLVSGKTFMNAIETIDGGVF